MKFLKKHWSNLLMVLLIVFLLYPPTGKPIKVVFNQLLAISPSEVAVEDRLSIRNFDWKLQDLEGNELLFGSARGEVIVLNLWASWCPPCIAEMPSFQKIYQDYGDRVRFFFVSAEDKKAIATFMKKKEYDLPVYRPLGPAPELLGSNRLPTTYVISRNGEIVVNKTGAANWNADNFRKLLDGLLQE